MGNFSKPFLDCNCTYSPPSNTTSTQRSSTKSCPETEHNWYIVKILEIETFDFIIIITACSIDKLLIEDMFLSKLIFPAVLYAILTFKPIINTYTQTNNKCTSRIVHIGKMRIFVLY